MGFVVHTQNRLCRVDGTTEWNRTPVVVSSGLEVTQSSFHLPLLHDMCVLEQ